MGSTLDGCLEKRTGYGLLYSFHSLVVALALTDTDMSNTLVDHDSLNIRKVEVDQCRQINQVCNALYSLLQNLICFSESFRHGSPAVYDLKQTVIWDDDQCVYILF